MKAILKRELRFYYHSFTGYAFAAVLLLFAGIYTMAICLQSGYSNFEYVLGNIGFIFLLIVPILTMRTFAEEKKQKTDQLLYSLPTGMLRIVMGKYLALLLVFLVPVMILSIYPLVLSLYGNLAMKTVYSTIFAFFLLGASLLAIGMFISTLTESQPFAAGGTFVVLLLDYLAPSLADFLPAGGSIVSALCLFTPLENFLYGIFDINGIVFYLSTIILFLFLTVQALEKRRWS
ncbi:MAG: ABC transporter permease [Anaerovoracaceae bacterium]